MSIKRYDWEPGWGENESHDGEWVKFEDLVTRVKNYVESLDDECMDEYYDTDKGIASDVLNNFLVYLDIDKIEFDLKRDE